MIYQYGFSRKQSSRHMLKQGIAIPFIKVTNRTYITKISSTSSSGIRSRLAFGATR
jgi:hypothetical protein